MLNRRSSILPLTGSRFGGSRVTMAQGITMPFFACTRLSISYAVHTLS